MQICAQASCKTTWKYIPFKFNENNVDTARELSMGLGMDHFQVDPSDRFDTLTEKYQPVFFDNLGQRYQAQQSWKQNNTASVDPKCNNNQNHYISADGYYSPCCYIADHRFYYKTDFGKNKKSYQIANQTLTEILTRPAVVEFYKDLTSHSVCQYNCPAT